MRLMAVGDVVDPLLMDSPAETGPPAPAIDFIVSCGDLPGDYLTLLAKRWQCPLFYVRGNHDGAFGYLPPADCTSIDGRALRWRGIRLVGLGGAPLYNGGTEQYSERAMALRVLRLHLALWRFGGVDIIVTHAPPRFPPAGSIRGVAGTLAGEGPTNIPGRSPVAYSDPGHRGFLALGALLTRYHPTLFLHGHTIMPYGAYPREIRIGSTRVINAYAHIIAEF